MLRTLCEAAAPTLFGYASANVFEGQGTDSGSGLQYTLLFFLLALVPAGLLGLVAMRTYPRDVATAQAFIERIEASPQEQREREEEEGKDGEDPSGTVRPVRGHLRRERGGARLCARLVRLRRVHRAAR
ncbi:hypothetical protein ACUJ8H_21015 [Streptomyces sp. EKR5.2]|uniref:hypothetical protein n=1 Tax=Streptomyces sp. EKR5.2 TaxID=3461014 RepID=UPI0040428406